MSLTKDLLAPFLLTAIFQHNYKYRHQTKYVTTMWSERSYLSSFPLLPQKQQKKRSVMLSKIQAEMECSVLWGHSLCRWLKPALLSHLQCNVMAWGPLGAPRVDAQTASTYQRSETLRTDLCTCFTPSEFWFLLVAEEQLGYLTDGANTARCF